MTLCPELAEGPGDPEEPYSRWYECYTCGARSPLAGTDEAAYLAAAAMPINLPLTHEQVEALGDLDRVWVVARVRYYYTHVEVRNGKWVKAQCLDLLGYEWASTKLFFAAEPTQEDIDAARMAADKEGMKK